MDHSGATQTSFEDLLKALKPKLRCVVVQADRLNCKKSIEFWDRIILVKISKCSKNYAAIVILVKIKSENGHFVSINLHHCSAFEFLKFSENQKPYIVLKLFLYNHISLYNILYILYSLNILTEYYGRGRLKFYYKK